MQYGFGLMPYVKNNFIVRQRKNPMQRNRKLYHTQI